MPENTLRELNLLLDLIAYRAAGIAGAICVTVVGWTTANPTIYRAGLALQSIRSKWKTWRVTIVIGLLLTFIPSFLVFLKGIELETNKHLMLVGTLLWFGSSPFWMNRKVNN